MNLIYTIAYNSDAWHQAVMMVDSMRRVGKFDGHIKVFSDTNAQMDGAEVIYAPTYPERVYAIMALRWLIGMELDVSGYDKVAMIDSDILAISPMNEMFDFSHDGVRVPEEFPDGRVYHGNSPWSIADIEFAQDRPVHNCGTVIAKAAYWKYFSTLMWEFMRFVRPMILQPYIWIDQQVLNHLIRKGLVPHQQFPDNWVYLFRAGKEIGPETKLFHMIPNGKERAMRGFYGLILEKHKACAQ